MGFYLARFFLSEDCGHMGDPKTQVDLSYHDFVAFLFDYNLSLESEGKDHWYWHVEVEFDARKIAAYYVRMFN